MSNEELTGQILALRTVVEGVLADHPLRQDILGRLHSLVARMRSAAPIASVQSNDYELVISGMDSVARQLDPVRDKIKKPTSSDLERQVAVVGEAWANSRYYDDAEQWTPMFWKESGNFRPLFDKLDLTSVVELACGHGRHAEQIAAMAGHVVLTDIFGDNLEFCRQRLGHHDNIEFLKGTGTSYPVADESTTAIFCYDAMVHFSPDIVGAYLNDAFRILKSGGRALLHHSNYPAPLDRHYGGNPHARNHMTVDLFIRYAHDAGLKILESRVINWGSAKDLDAITLVQKP